MKKQKKIALIFGITGQDGSYLSELLLKKKYIVHGVKRRSSSFNTGRVDHLYQDPHEKTRKFILHYGDVTDAISVSSLIKKIQPDEVYNLAAQSHVAVSFEVPEYTANADALGALRILEAIRFHKLQKKFETEEYFINLKHAAYTNTKKILFLNRGVDISRPLSAQNDCFWWGYQNFSQINKPYFSFKRIVRGYQSNTHNDIENAKTRILCTLFKQPLENKKILAGIFSKNGDILELFESN